MSVWICVCVCVCIRQDLSFYSIDFNRTGLISFVFFCVIACQKSVFWLGRCVLVLFRIFNFLKIYFCFFLMVGSRYFNRIGSTRKRIKKPIFSRKNYFSSYHNSFVINKNVFYFRKLITPKLNNFLEKNHGNAEYK